MHNSCKKDDGIIYVWIGLKSESYYNIKGLGSSSITKHQIL